MRNWIFKFFLFAAAPFYAYGEDFENCQVVDIRFGVDDRNAHVKLDCMVTPRPACAVSGDYVGFDRATESGKQKLSLFLTAFASGARVSGNVDDSACPAYQGNIALLTSMKILK